MECMVCSAQTVMKYRLASSDMIIDAAFCAKHMPPPQVRTMLRVTVIEQ